MCDNQNRRNTVTELRWASRVRPEKIRRLYETEARGLVDEELLEDVLLTMYLRCQSILTCTQAAAGEVKCPHCGLIIRRQNLSNDKESKAEIIKCVSGAWQTTWGEFFKSYQGKQLFAGGAGPAIQTFVQGFDTARTARAKLMLIDALIHAYHWEMNQNPTRPVAVNMIEGNNKTVIELIEGLAYGDDAPGLKATKAAWDEKTRTADEKVWKGSLRGG